MNRNHAEAIPGMQGDLLRSGKKTLRMALSSPVMDAIADMQVESDGAVADIPWDRLVYRTSQNLILTSSMISRGIGAGQTMSPVSSLSDDEAMELLENLKLLFDPTPFEYDLKKDIQESLDMRWS